MLACLNEMYKYCRIFLLKIHFVLLLVAIQMRRKNKISGYTSIPTNDDTSEWARFLLIINSRFQTSFVILVLLQKNI